MESEFVIDNNNDTLIVCFGGFASEFGGILPFEFLNFFSKNFPNIDKYFYKDKKQMCYHCGISNITNNIDETVSYLDNKIKKYKKVIFTGNSAGAYAAILFGSLLKIPLVITFNSITILYGRKHIYNPLYVNLSENVINDTTQYHLFTDTNIVNIKDNHHIYQSMNISKYPNVNITKKKGIDLKQMKISGELYNIYNEIING